MQNRKSSRELSKLLREKHFQQHALSREYDHVITLKSLVIQRKEHAPNLSFLQFAKQ